MPTALFGSQRVYRDALTKSCRGSAPLPLRLLRHRLPESESPRRTCREDGGHPPSHQVTTSPEGASFPGWWLFLPSSAPRGDRCWRVPNRCPPDGPKGLDVGSISFCLLSGLGRGATSQKVAVAERSSGGRHSVRSHPRHGVHPAGATVGAQRRGRWSGLETQRGRSLRSSESRRIHRSGAHGSWRRTVAPLAQLGGLALRPESERFGHRCSMPPPAVAWRFLARDQNSALVHSASEAGVAGSQPFHRAGEGVRRKRYPCQSAPCRAGYSTSQCRTPRRQRRAWLSGVEWPVVCPDLTNSA
jgi:hypothetical protein